MKYITFDFAEAEMRELAIAISAYHDIAIRKGAICIHDSYTCTLEQAEAIAEEFGSRFPQFKSMIELVKARQ